MVVFEALAITGTVLSIILVTIKVINKIRRSKCVVVDEEGVVYKMDFTDIKSPTGKQQKISKVDSTSSDGSAGGLQTGVELENVRKEPSPTDIA